MTNYHYSTQYVVEKSTDQYSCGADLPCRPQPSRCDWHHPAQLPLDTTERRGNANMSDNDNDIETEQDVDILLAEPQVAKPPMYAVVMYNDDYTPMEFVVYILESEFKHSADEAIEIMLNIHHKGRGIAGIYPKDIAETKAKKVNTTARKEGYPLLTQIEPHHSE